MSFNESNTVGSTSCVFIRIIDDDFLEHNETFQFSIASSNQFVTVDGEPVVITIANDDSEF